MKAKNNDKIETRGKSCTSDNTETTTLKMKDNYGMLRNKNFLLFFSNEEKLKDNFFN